MGCRRKYSQKFWFFYPLTLASACRFHNVRNRRGSLRWRRSRIAELPSGANRCGAVAMGDAFGRSTAASRRPSPTGRGGTRMASRGPLMGVTMSSTPYPRVRGPVPRDGNAGFPSKAGSSDGNARAVSAPACRYRAEGCRGREPQRLANAGESARFSAPLPDRPMGQTRQEPRLRKRRRGCPSGTQAGSVSPRTRRLIVCANHPRRRRAA